MADGEDIGDAAGGPKRVIVTVHGIRTFGQWQGRLEKLIKAADPNAEVVSYQYGFFSVLAFLIPPLRAIRVRSFRRVLKGIVADHPDAEITLIGHSFGTHMIGWAISKGFEGDKLTFVQLILSGSVLRQDFDWQRLIDKDVVGRVINDCGADDNILLLSQLGVLFTGMAGRLGFSGATGVTLFNRIYLGGHSHYFVDSAGGPDDRFMQANWMPLIMGTGRPYNLDMRTTPTAVRGFLHWLIQNADGMKIAVLAAIAVLGWQQIWAAPRQEAAGEKMARLRVVAMQQLANDETVPQGVATLLAIARQNPSDRDALELASHWLPQLVDLRTIMKARGFPAFFEWNGRNLLLLPGRTVAIPGDAIENHAFTTDGKLLLTFDANASIRIFDASSGKPILIVRTRVEDEDDDGGAREPIFATEVPAPTESAALPKDELEAAIEAGSAAAEPEGPAELPSLQPGSQPILLAFRESRDGSQLLGMGYTASASAGSSEPIIFLLDRRTLAYSLCEFTSSEIGFLEDGGRLRLFLQPRHDSPYFEIAEPRARGDCAYRNVDRNGRILPADPALVGRIAASRTAVPGVGIATFGWKQKPSHDDSAATEAAKSRLIFPRLVAPSSLWSTSALPTGDWMSLGFGTSRNLRGTRPISEVEGVQLRQALRTYAASPRGEESRFDIEYQVGPTDEVALRGPLAGTVVVSDVPGNVLALIEGFGNTYVTTLFCRMKKLGAPIEYCGGVNLFGDSTSVAQSPGNRYVAGADIAIGTRPSLHLHDVLRNREIIADRQPQGIVYSVAFDPLGKMVFAATPYGIWAYDLPDNGTATFNRLYQVAGLSVRYGKSEFMTSQIAVGPEQVYYLTDDGLLQAISRKTGEVDWMQEQRGGQMILDSATGQLAVWDDECVSLLHARSGARLTSRFCPVETFHASSPPEGEDLVLGARFSQAHQLEFWTYNAVYSFDRIAPEAVSLPASTGLFARIAGWLRWNDANDRRYKSWESRTGFHGEDLPATLRAELNPTVPPR